MLCHGNVRRLAPARLFLEFGIPTHRPIVTLAVTLGKRANVTLAAAASDRERRLPQR